MLHILYLHSYMHVCINMLVFKRARTMFTILRISSLWPVILDKKVISSKV